MEGILGVGREKVESSGRWKEATKRGRKEEREREKRHVVQVDAIRAEDRTQCLWLSSLTCESLTNVLFLPCM